MDTIPGLQALLDQLQLEQGCNAARDAILGHCRERILAMTRKYFRRETYLRTISQTDDVFMQVMMRLYKTLATVRPADSRALYGLTSQHIRWVLKDMARKYAPPRQFTLSEQPLEWPDEKEGPEELAQWAEFHEAIEALPAEERELFDLLFYEGVEQAEAANVLGIPLRTLKRHWQKAKEHLAEKLNG